MRDHDEVFRRVMEAKEQYEQQEKTRFGSVFAKKSGDKAAGKAAGKRSMPGLAAWGKGALCAAAALAVVAVTVAAIQIRLSQKKPSDGTGAASTPTETVDPTGNVDPTGKQEPEKATDQEIAEAYFPENYSGYRYPVLGGMTTWPYGNHGDMVNVCRIPEEKLTGMSTEDLVQTVLFYPLFPDVLAYDSVDMGYNAIKNSFNGLKELCEREDRIEALKSVVKNHKDWFIVEPVSEDGAEVPFKNIHQSLLFLIYSEDFKEAFDEIAAELRLTVDDIDFNGTKEPFSGAKTGYYGSYSESLYDKALQEADEKQRKQLENLSADGVFPVTNAAQCSKQIQIIRGILAADTPNITVEQAEAICAGTEKEFIGDGACKLVDSFNAIAGAPDVDLGSTGDRMLVYYTNAEKTEYIRIHWIMAVNCETSVEFHAKDGSAREIRLWK